MTVAVGDTVLEGMPILRVHGTASAPPLHRLSDAVALVLLLLPRPRSTGPAPRTANPSRGASPDGDVIIEGEWQREEDKRLK